MKTKAVRVSMRPYIFEGREGYRLKWHDGVKTRAYFVLSRDMAKATKARAKDGKLPTCWAVKC